MNSEKALKDITKKEKPTPNIKLTFDGCGINDANDPYHRRLFTIPRQNCDEYRELSSFIVRAVNSNGALLEAAIYAINELKNPHPNPENKQLTIHALEEAIAMAEGDTSNKCAECKKEGHDQCPLFPDCPCCEDTIDRMNAEGGK